jgi:hypothetical protein
MPRTTRSNLGPDWDIPTGICRAARKGAVVIRQFAIQHGLTHTGGRVFYSPQEWRERGERHATHSLLVIVYDGAAIRQALSFDGLDYALMEKLRTTLDALDLFTEECTCWYCGLHNA